MHTPTEFKEGMYCYGTKPKNLEVVGMPNGHDWSPADEDWHLPEGWKDIVLNGMEDLMKKYRSFKLYMDCLLYTSRGSARTTTRSTASTRANGA